MCCNCIVTHGSGCVPTIKPHLFICGPCDNDSAPPPPPPPPPAIVSPFGCLLGLLCRCAPFTGCVEASQHCWLIGGNAFVSGCYWASAALSSGVMVHAGRCYKRQIRRCYPVNKEPAETSCQQQRGETCDFKHGHMTDSWWCAYRPSLKIEYDAQW